MKPVTKTLTSVGTSTPLLTNPHISPFNIGFVASISGTVSSYTINYSMDDPYSATGLVNWFPTTISGASAAANGNIAFPITALQIVITTGTGTVTLVATQAGI